MNGFIIIWILSSPLWAANGDVVLDYRGDIFISLDECQLHRDMDVEYINEDLIPKLAETTDVPTKRDFWITVKCVKAYSGA